MKVAIVFLLAVALVNASLPANLVRRSQPVLNQALSKTRQQLTTSARFSSSRDLALNSVNDVLSNLEQQAQQLLGQIEAALASGQAIVQQYIEQILSIIAQIQENGPQMVQNIISQLMSMLGSRSGQRNFLIDMLINAVLGSDKIQALLKGDPTLQCLRRSGIDVNTQYLMNMIDSNGAHNFITVVAASCIEETGGLQNVVQKSALIQYAWGMVKTFGLQSTVKKAIVKHLGVELGNEVVGYLSNNPHARSIISDLIGQVGSLIPGNLLELIQTNLAPLANYLEDYIQEYVATMLDQGQAAMEYLLTLLRPYLEQIQAVLPGIYQQLQNFFGELAY